MDNQSQFEEPFDAAPSSVETTAGKQGKEKKEVPRPPSAQAKVRTMQSDIKSLQESGGQAPQPYLVEIDHPKAVPTTPLPPIPKILFIILGILVLILIIVLGLIWLT